MTGRNDRPTGGLAAARRGGRDQGAGQSSPPQGGIGQRIRLLTARQPDAPPEPPPAPERGWRPGWLRPAAPEPPPPARSRWRWWGPAEPQPPKRGRRKRRPRSRRLRRVTGCLMWVATILLVLLVLSILFGGFQRGSKVGGSGQPHVVPAAASRAPA
jgi:hypothetical protein